MMRRCLRLDVSSATFRGVHDDVTISATAAAAAAAGAAVWWLTCCKPTDTVGTEVATCSVGRPQQPMSNCGSSQ